LFDGELEREEEEDRLSRGDEESNRLMGCHNSWTGEEAEGIK